MNSSKKILLVGRDNWQNDDELNLLLYEYLSKSKHEIIWEDPAGNLLYQFIHIIDQQKSIPTTIKKILIHWTQFIYRAFYHSFIIITRKNVMVHRSQKLKKVISKLGDEKDIVILSRSSGGRLSSLIADELKVKHIICLGYPFQHPEKGVEPERYEHLKYLKTPMLILQGEQDEYGGIEIKNKYELSPSIKMSYVATDHEFKLCGDGWNEVLTQINHILN
ncbi:alpha/beta family hydrolase [Flavobacterium sp. NG2]|uniref:alpha/beta family hydrolase n=1 Tax=Flavobacterium sp. NG2 TaxID=3097547 RepID=UPI002A8004BE|nr:alpha/beta family hydrolase [Flavobacterium sp. NG2]WPR72505.1 alpha/beta family hydrolase [Flavobacterium sp. NG2]